VLVTGALEELSMYNVSLPQISNHKFTNPVLCM
jgi:hypothetical protein